ncbi:MAG: ATP-binding cassette domain-containing protein [Spirochaetales bacterium]|nr:ATP-binding cassette domain-containing protein [Spirochaetales bacterium]
MINIDHLTKYYDSNTCAVDDLCLEINKGEVLGLLGPNGAGKTTTLRILTGFLEPTEGTVIINGLDVQRDPLKIKKSIGYLPESAPLYPEMFTYDYLSYIADIRGLAGSKKNSRIDQLADICSIREVMHKQISILSKGYKQRVGLAHAMMSDPEILVLDEPTSGLDPNQIVEIRSIIKEIGKEKTIILSTHILSEAEAACDRVVIINKGKIVADGSTDMLKKQAGSSRVLSAVLRKATHDEIKEFVMSLPDTPNPEIQNIEDGIKVRFQTGEDLRASFYEGIKKRDWVLLEMFQEARSLETIFHELTREK